jgi:hypothetical protein
LRPVTTQAGLWALLLLEAPLRGRFDPASEILRGSLLHRLIRHRRGCPKCARGGGRPVWVLTVSYPGGATKQFTIPAAQIPVVREWLNNYRQLKRKLEAIRELNHRLVRPEK